jgi:1-acyl-sn-glycerol-3-phosphate acyltransferase
MIRTIVVFVYVPVSMIFLIPFGVIAMLFRFLGLKKPMAWFVCWFAAGWGRFLLLLSGCTVNVTGRENIPKKGGVCFVSNHCGYFDIVLLLAYCGRPIGFVAKKELLFIPVLNAWIYMVGGLFIDRKSVRKAMRTIHNGVAKIKKDGGMIIFPEGHRSKGRGLLPFHSGSLKLATMAEAQIVPVAISGSYEVFEKNGRVVRSSLKLSFCPLIVTAGLSHEAKKQALSDRIFSVIKTELEKHAEVP